MRHPALLIFALLALALPLVPTQAQPANERCFAETGYCIGGDILTFWENNGGLPVFGLPLSARHSQSIASTLRQVQLFERARIELHPENEPPYDVQLGSVGVELLEQQGRDWRTFPRGKRTAETCRYFAETGQHICGDILAAWRASGIDLNDNGIAGDSEAENLALFGLPLGPEHTETLADGRQYTVQWFQRARFERHPENAPPADVLLGRLGSELASPPPVSLPVIDMFTYDSAALTRAWDTAASGNVTLSLEADASAADPPVLRVDADLPCTSGEQERSMRLIRRFATPQDFTPYSSLVVRARGDGISAEPFGGEFTVTLWDAAGAREEPWQSTRWLQRDTGWHEYTIALRDAGAGNPWDHAQDFVLPVWEEPVNGQFDLERIAGISIIASTTSDECAAHPAMSTWIDSIVLRP